MPGEDGKTNRRDFLRAVSVAATATTAGCSVRFGDFVIEAGEEHEGEQVTASTVDSLTETPTNTPTRGSPTSRTRTSTDSQPPTRTESSNVSLDDLEPRGPTPDLNPTDPDLFPDSQLPDFPDVEETETAATVGDRPATAERAPTATESSTPDQESFKIENLQLHVRKAADAAFNKPNTVELFGEVAVKSSITSVQTVWKLIEEQAIEIEEGDRVPLGATPTHFRVFDGFPERDQVEIMGVMGEADTGLNAPDRLYVPTRLFTIRDIPTDVRRHGPIVDNRRSPGVEVYMGYEISRS